MGVLVVIVQTNCPLGHLSPARDGRLRIFGETQPCPMPEVNGKCLMGTPATSIKRNCLLGEMSAFTECIRSHLVQ